MSAVDSDTGYIPSEIIITTDVSWIGIYKGQNISVK